MSYHIASHVSFGVMRVPSLTVVKYFLNDKGKDTARQSWKIWLCLSLGLLLLLLRGGTLRLDVLIVDGQRLVNLGLQSSLVLNAKRNKVNIQS